jgi:glycosyltransferase involved in cell wall biosynthesis
LKHRNEKRGFTAADAVVFDSRHTCALVAAAYGLDTTRCHPIHGGLDEDHFRPPDVHQRRAARDRLGISPEDIVVAWTGRFSPEKNLELLLRALPECQSKPARVLLVGDGPTRPALVELTGRLGLEGIVQFPGRQSDVRPFLQAADVFAFPSHGESFGGALVEAMGCALACVALRPNGREVRNANCEIIDQGQSGLLVDRPHPRAFAAALDLLARDASLRQRLGEAAHHRANRLFTWSAGARQLNALISELVRQHLRSDIHPGGIETSTPVAAGTVR